jgi:GH35 family endo-1,4-beta-xylanase
MKNNYPIVLILSFFLFVQISSVRSQSSDFAELMKEAAENVEKYRKGDVEIMFYSSSGKPIENASVKIDQISQDFLFGNIIFPLVGVLHKFRDMDVYRPEIFKERFKGIFNMAIFPFYWSAYEDIQGRPNWQRILPALEWCQLNGITAKGHPLAWGESGGTPKWIYDLPVEQTEDFLEARIKNIVRGFKGQIDVWDVVNEPTHTKTWSAIMKEPFVMRYTDRPIPEIADWIEKCYRWANDANPEAELVINDYEQIVSTFIMDTRQRFYDLIAELQKRGTPLHGVGLQAHEPRLEWYSPHEFWKTLDFYAELGLPLHITEFVPQSSDEKINGWKEGTWSQESQAEFAEQIYRLSFGHPSVQSINWWGLSDRYIWQERLQGGLIDEDYKPKLVYKRLKTLIKDEWMTKGLEQSLSNGSTKFRGFFGEYKISVMKDDNNIQVFYIHVNPKEANKFEFTIN